MCCDIIVCRKAKKPFCLSHLLAYHRKTKEEQQQFQQQRAEEIYSTMRAVKQLARKRSMQVAHSVEERWRESEQKAKAFERTRKASFNQARKLSQRVCVSSVVDSNPSSIA